MFLRLFLSFMMGLLLASGRDGVCQEDHRISPRKVGTPSGGPVATEHRANDGRTRWEDVAWAWQKDPELLRQRERALSVLYSVGMYPLPAAGEFKSHELDDAAVRQKAARSPLLGFSTKTLDSEFGYSPDRATDGLTDEVFRREIRWFPEIRWLSLVSTDLTDEALRVLPEMKYLETFHLLHLYPPVHPARMTDDGMKTLAKVESLKELRFLGVKLTDAGIENLSRLPRLERITLEATYATPECLRRLVGMPSVRFIHLRGNRGVHGSLSYQDLPNYDRLARAISPQSAKNMECAKGAAREVWIDETLAIDPSVFEALCKTPTVSRIKFETFTYWSSPGALASLNGQEHLIYVQSPETRAPTAEAITVLSRVLNNAVRLETGTARGALPIVGWLEWAKNRE